MNQQPDTRPTTTPATRPTRSKARPFVITAKGRRYRFATLEGAQLTARQIFEDTGIVVGIEARP